MIVPIADPMSLQFCPTVCKSGTKRKPQLCSCTNVYLQSRQILHCSIWLLEVPVWYVGDTFNLFIRSLKQLWSMPCTCQSLAALEMESNGIELNSFKSNPGRIRNLHVGTACVQVCVFAPLKSFDSIHPWRCLLKDQFGSAVGQTQPDTWKRDGRVNMTVVNKSACIVYVCVCVSHSVSLSAVNQWC